MLLVLVGMEHLLIALATQTTFIHPLKKFKSSNIHLTIIISSIYSRLVRTGVLLFKLADLFFFDKKKSAKCVVKFVI